MVLLTPAFLRIDHIAWIRLATGFFGTALGGDADAIVLRDSGGAQERHYQNAADQGNYNGRSRHHDGIEMWLKSRNVEP